MFKVKESLLEKISEFVQNKQPALATGIVTMARCSTCQGYCGGACSVSCAGVCRDGCQASGMRR